LKVYSNLWIQILDLINLFSNFKEAISTLGKVKEILKAGGVIAVPTGKFSW